MENQVGIVKKSREANFELLRIISMILIVISHAMTYGGVLGETTGGTINYYIVWFLRGLCRVSVPSFVMICGYFMYDKKLHLRKLIHLWVTILFFSAGIYIIACICGLETFHKSMLLKYLLPISTERYWFTTTYMLLLLISPIINSAIKSMSKTFHFSCIVILVFVFSIMDSLTSWSGDFSRVNSGASIQWFITLYLIAAYMKKYPKNNGNCIKYFIGYIIFAALTPGVTILLLRSEKLIPWIIYEPYAFWNTNSIFVLGETLCMFNFIKNLRIKSLKLSQIILTISPLVFTVYLIHEHNLLRSVIWKGIFYPGKYANSGWLVPYIIICALTVFIVCCIIEWIRSFVWKKIHIDSCITRLSDGVESRLLKKIHSITAE